MDSCCIVACHSHERWMHSTEGGEFSCSAHYKKTATPPLSQLLLILEMTTPAAAAFFSFLGSTIAVSFATLGSAYGISRSAVGLCATGVLRPQSVLKNLSATILATILGIYGLILSVLIVMRMSPTSMTMYQGLANLGAGMSAGISCLAAGFAIGIVGDAGVRAVVQQPSLYVAWMLVLIFGEALAIYGLIIGILTTQMGAK